LTTDAKAKAMYQPTLGRFLSRDPLSANGVDVLTDTGFHASRLAAMRGNPSYFSGTSFNAYAYAYNNPVNYSDPSGLKPAVNCGQGNETNCVNAAIALAQNALNNQACLKNLTQLLGNKANCTAAQLNDCISKVLNMMTVTCQDLTQAGSPKPGPCQIALAGGVYPYASNQDKTCFPSKIAATCNPCRPQSETDNCALCAGVNQIPVDLCRTPDAATFPKPYPANPALNTPIDKVYCAKGLNDPNLAVLASILLHEASHSCVGGHTFAPKTFAPQPFDQCGRPDATLVQNAYSTCMGWPLSKNPGTPKNP
jgi:RHS repeat-associated protein